MHKDVNELPDHSGVGWLDLINGRFGGVAATATDGRIKPASFAESSNQTTLRTAMPIINLKIRISLFFR